MKLTPTGFAVIVLLLLVAAIYVAAADNRRNHRETVQDAPEQVPDPCAGDCGISECHRPGTIPYRTTNGLLYVCLRHSGRVGYWVGYDNRVYDQDLDPATDFGTWNKEMDAS
jgi:hypothetical protein